MSGCPEAAQGPERVVFVIAMDTYFSNRQPPREHLRVERDKLSPKPPTLQLYAQTRWTGSATLLSTVLQNREAITAVFFKAKQEAIDMAFDTFFEAAMDVSTCDAIAEWEPVLRYIAVVTDYLQSDSTPRLASMRPSHTSKLSWRRL
jgi:hypothetical protein